MFSETRRQQEKIGEQIIDRSRERRSLNWARQALHHVLEFALFP